MNGGRPKACVSWSSGKDSAYALWETRRAGALDVACVLTTVNEAFARVAMHGVRDALLDRQLAALGLPCVKVPIPSPCPNEVYEARMREATARLKADGVGHMVFGDLFLEDIRAYREQRLAEAGMTGVYPLWGRDTAALAREMVANGLVAHLTCIDPRRLDRSFAGRRYDASLLDDLPADVDPCGENGEFHTVVTAGPMFAAPIAVGVGDVVERDGFVFADVVPA
ncbi:MAG: ATP-binding protein [Sphingomonadales bacterium]